MQAVTVKHSIYRHAKSKNPGREGWEHPAGDQPKVPTPGIRLSEKVPLHPAAMDSEFGVCKCPTTSPHPLLRKLQRCKHEPTIVNIGCSRRPGPLGRDLRQGGTKFSVRAVNVSQGGVDGALWPRDRQDGWVCMVSTVHAAKHTQKTTLFSQMHAYLHRRSRRDDSWQRLDSCILAGQKAGLACRAVSSSATALGGERRPVSAGGAARRKSVAAHKNFGLRHR